MRRLLLVEPHNVDELAGALIRVLSETSFAKVMGSKAREGVENLFTWRIAAEKIMAIYEELLEHMRS